MSANGGSVASTWAKVAALVDSLYRVAYAMLKKRLKLMNEPVPKHPEARAHHFVPQCWLAGFTDTGQKDGQLWVTDFKRQKQWPTSPPNAGHRKDFYRIDEPDTDPLVFENAFGDIETQTGPVFRSLYNSPHYPTGKELETLLWFAAVQFMRVPAFRQWILGIAESIHLVMVSKALESPETWKQALVKAGIPTDEPAAAYERMVEFQQRVLKTGEYTMEANTAWYLARGFQGAANTVFPLLLKRYWGMLHSPSGSFIGSDNPVGMDGPKGQLSGFKCADVILFPVNRYILLVGTNEPVKQPFVNRKLIARYNTFTMLAATEQLYSHEPNFGWLDENSKYQESWELFSKKRIVSAEPPAITLALAKPRG